MGWHQGQGRDHVSFGCNSVGQRVFWTDLVGTALSGYIWTHRNGSVVTGMFPHAGFHLVLTK